MPRFIRRIQGLTFLLQWFCYPRAPSFGILPAFWNIRAVGAGHVDNSQVVGSQLPPSKLPFKGFPFIKLIWEFPNIRVPKYRPQIVGLVRRGAC